MLAFMGEHPWLTVALACVAGFTVMQCVYYVVLAVRPELDGPKEK